MKLPLSLVMSAPDFAAGDYTDRAVEDVEVQTGGYEVPEGYREYPVPFEYDRDEGHFVAHDRGGIEWYPTFDEVYDYIDALVDEYDLDAHDLFEMAFGYGEDATV